MGAPGDGGDREPTLDESSGDEEEVRFQEKLERSETAFAEYRIGEGSLSNLKADVLQAMCRARDLQANSSKGDLAKRLIHWVRVIA